MGLCLTEGRDPVLNERLACLVAGAATLLACASTGEPALDQGAAAPDPEHGPKDDPAKEDPSVDDGTRGGPRGRGLVERVSAALGYACALENDGTVACWGRNDYGNAAPPAGTFW